MTLADARMLLILKASTMTTLADMGTRYILDAAEAKRFAEAIRTVVGALDDRR